MLRPPVSHVVTPNPDHAWKALSLVNEWIRHSDAKAGVTLAFTGVLSTLLFNLAHDSPLRGVVFDAVVVLACCLILLTAIFCGMTLTPRMKDRDAVPEAINRLFYQSITKNFSGDRLGFTEVLNTLSSDPSQIMIDLAHQIHANARIATVKGRHAKWAIWSALSAGLTVGVVALLTGLASFD